MTPCDETWSRAATGEVLTSALTAHAAGCPRCRHLLALDAVMARRARASIAPGPALRAALAADPDPVVLRSPVRRAGATVLVLAGVLVATVALTPVRGDSAGVLCALGLAAMAALGVALVFYRGHDGLGAPVWLRRLYPVAAVGLFLAVAVAAPGTGRSDAWAPGLGMTLAARSDLTGAAGASGHRQGTVTGDTGQNGSGAGGCASYGLVLTLLAGATALAGARRTAVVAPAATGLCAGVAAGMLGAAALALHGAAGAGHVLSAHGLPVAAGAVLGVVVGRRVLAP